jgi:hypothetical protein
VRDEFYGLLAEPGPESWAGIVRLLSDPRRRFDPAEAAEVERDLRAWPPEVERPAPRAWLPESHAALLKLARTVREVDLYPHYIRAAAESPRLRLRDGTPAVRLQRSFSGALQGAHGRMHQIGVPGQGDLCGSLCVEVHCSDATCYSSRTTAGPCEADHWRRLAASLEIEVKRGAGKQSPVQRQREEALRRRGELYLCVRTTAEMLRLLESERDRILRDLGHTRAATRS